MESCRAQVLIKAVFCAQHQAEEGMPCKETVTYNDRLQCGLGNWSLMHAARMNN